MISAYNSLKIFCEFLLQNSADEIVNRVNEADDATTNILATMEEMSAKMMQNKNKCMDLLPIMWYTNHSKYNF